MQESSEHTMFGAEEEERPHSSISDYCYAHEVAAAAPPKVGRSIIATQRHGK